MSTPIPATDFMGGGELTVASPSKPLNTVPIAADSFSAGAPLKVVAPMTQAKPMSADDFSGGKPLIQTNTGEENVKGIISSIGEAWNDSSNTSFNPEKIGAAATKSYVSAIDDASVQTDAAYDKLVSDYKQNPSIFSAQTAGNAVDFGIKALGSILSPLTSGPLKALENMPVLGYVPKGINAIFSAIGTGASEAAVGALDGLPLSSETKQKLTPAVQSAAALAAQIALGKYGEEALMGTPTKETGSLNIGGEGGLNLGGTVKSGTVGIIPAFVSHVKSIVDGIKGDPEIGAPIKESALAAAQATDKTYGLQAVKDKYDPQRFSGVFQNNRGLGGEPTFTPEQQEALSKPAQPVGRETPAVSPETDLETMPKDKTAPISSKEPTAPITASTASKSGKTVPVRTAASAADVGQMADIYHISAEKGYEDIPDTEKAKYSPTTVKEQVDKVGALMRDNMDDARAMIRGEKPVPNGMSSQVLFNAMERYGIENRDGEVMSELAKSPIASKLSTSGQEMGLHGATDNPHSPVAAVREITQARESEYLRKNKTTSEKAKGDIVKSERANLDKELKAARSTRPTWESFIKKLSCQA